MKISKLLFLSILFLWFAKNIFTQYNIKDNRETNKFRSDFFKFDGVPTFLEGSNLVNPIVTNLALSL